MAIEALCWDDTKRPNEIPANLWVKADNIYHITHIYKQLNQPGVRGVELAEFDISHCAPYNSYRLNRFIINPSQLEACIQMMMDCNDLNSIDMPAIVEQLINSEELILQE